MSAPSFSGASAAEGNAFGDHFVFVEAVDTVVRRAPKDGHVLKDLFTPHFCRVVRHALCALALSCRQYRGEPAKNFCFSFFSKRKRLCRIFRNETISPEHQPVGVILECVVPGTQTAFLEEGVWPVPQVCQVAGTLIRLLAQVVRYVLTQNTRHVIVCPQRFLSKEKQKLILSAFFCVGVLSKTTRNEHHRTGN